MKNPIYYTLFVCLLTICPVWASYTYEVYDYGNNKTLHDGESILVDLLGGMDGLTLEDDSYAKVNDTSDLIEGFGGIWYLSLSNNSSLDMLGGEIHRLTLNNNATAILTGGMIESIYSYQNISSGPHITIVYSGDLPEWNSNTNVLTGLWGNGDPFSIQLVDVAGYSPAIDNIRFELIPEPATLALLGLGAFLLKKKKRRPEFGPMGNRCSNQPLH